MSLIQAVSQAERHRSIGGHGYVYNLEGNIDNYRAAVADVLGVGATTHNINVIGDSLVNAEGGVFASASEQMLQGFVGRFRTRMNTIFGDVGLGFYPSFFSNDFLIDTYAGTWTNGTTYGVGGSSRDSTDGAGTSTITVSFVGTGIGVVVAKHATALQILLNVDAEGATAHDLYNASTVRAVAIEKTGYANDTHELVLTVDDGGTNPSGAVSILGFYPIQGTAGLRINTMGKFGSRVVSHCGASGLAVSNLFTPVLSLLCFSANDFFLQTALATFRSNLETLIGGITSGDIILVADGSYNTSKTIPQTSYEEVMKQVALANSCAFINSNARWGTPANANTLGYLDDALVHPGAKGHYDLALHLLSSLVEYR